MVRAIGNDIDGAYIRVGTLEELRAKGMMVVSGEHCPLLVVYDEERVFALDNRCPHLGFPLHRGSVKDNVLTCHWHHARFDVASGCTFDLWADDIPTAAVEVRDGEVWVAARTRRAGDEAYWRNRLRAGLEQDIGLVIAKAVLGLTADGVDAPAMIREAALFGARNRDGWGTGLTILTALANVLPWLPEEETYLALYKGIHRVADDCEGQAPRRDREPLRGVTRPLDRQPLDRLTRWLRHWTAVRHRDGAERTLLSAIAAGTSQGELAAMMLVAATDRYFADGGHAVDFVNKAFECLDVIGWEHATEVLPTVVEQMVSARGGEELNAWRHPVDLVPLCEAAFAALSNRLARGADQRGNWRAHTALAQALLGEDPETIVAALQAAVAEGAAPTDLSRTLAYAAALRVAHFGTANEFSDWDAAHHVFTYCNALHQLLKRIAAAQSGRPVNPELLRGVFHGAMRLYLIRFLNVPPARIPGERDAALAALPVDADDLLSSFLAALDRQGAVTRAARLVARYLLLRHPVDALIATLTRSVLREDAGFHLYQMLEVGVRQYREWGESEPGRHILIAAARYLAAHSPTERAQLQTAMVARRLSRGESVHAGESQEEYALSGER
jgi:nitrite reductase/ring-hydroxylating ferredoxin subunit